MKAEPTSYSWKLNLMWVVLVVVVFIVQFVRTESRLTSIELNQRSNQLLITTHLSQPDIHHEGLSQIESKMSEMQSSEVDIKYLRRDIDEIKDQLKK